MGQLISIIVVVFCGHLGEHELAVSGNVCMYVYASFTFSP